jgi:hypothetical protein
MTDHAITNQTNHAGIAALSICEALLLTMNDRHLLPEREILGVLRDAAPAHQNAAGLDTNREMHEAVASLINRIISGGNFVRRP